MNITDIVSNTTHINLKSSDYLWIVLACIVLLALIPVLGIFNTVLKIIHSLFTCLCYPCRAQNRYTECS